MGHLLGPKKRSRYHDFLDSQADSRCYGPKWSAALVESCLFVAHRFSEVAQGRYWSCAITYTACAGAASIGGCISSKPDSNVELQPKSGFRSKRAPSASACGVGDYPLPDLREPICPRKKRRPLSTGDEANTVPSAHSGGAFLGKGPAASSTSLGAQVHEYLRAIVTVTDEPGQVGPNCRRLQLLLRTHRSGRKRVLQIGPEKQGVPLYYNS